MPYLLRSKLDGQYLVANANQSSYLLIYQEHFEALTYLNTHAGNLAKNFVVESVTTTELKNILQRWGFQGIGLVEDPLLPEIQFLKS